MSKIVGIDLGTSTSEIAYLDQGKPIVIPNHLGKFITPSVVHIKKDGEIIVGEEARERLLLEPECTFIEVKRQMGSDETLNAHEKTYSPQELSADILSYMISCAKEALGEDVNRAVITVPAYFTDVQRRATVEAGKLCGLTVERIINEPTAAALCYGLDHLEDYSNILVYDLGGGTLDVTVLELFEGVLEVRASSGNNKLGGKDFDEALIEYLLQKFSGNHQMHIRKDIRAMARLKEEAENCKIALSSQEQYQISLPFFAEVNGKPVSVDETITRNQFEKLISEKIDHTKEQLRIALSDARMKTNEVDLILMVGGSTRIPYVKKFLTDYFQKEPQQVVDPDLAVVQGAAIQAGILENQFEDNEIVLTDVCPYTLGVAALKYFDYYRLPTDMDLSFDPIIPRNVTIPTTIDRQYSTCTDHQKAVNIKVYQGEYSDPSLNNFLGEFQLDGIPPAPAMEEKINIMFSYDINGILNVDATIVSTGEKASITISTTENEMVEEVDTSKWRESKYAKKFSAIIKRAQRMMKEIDPADAELVGDLIKFLMEGLVKGESLKELNERKENLVELLLDLEQDDE